MKQRMCSVAIALSALFAQPFNGAYPCGVSRTNRRIATLMVHTSPLDQAGTGDAGGMNIYVLEAAQNMAAMGVEVDIFTRRTNTEVADIVEVSPGVRVIQLCLLFFYFYNFSFLLFFVIR